MQAATHFAVTSITEPSLTDVDINAQLVEGTDLGGPILIILALGVTLMLTGKLHFSYIYGIGMIGPRFFSQKDPSSCMASFSGKCRRFRVASKSKFRPAQKSKTVDVEIHLTLPNCSEIAYIANEREKTLSDEMTFVFISLLRFVCKTLSRLVFIFLTPLSRYTNWRT